MFLGAKGTKFSIGATTRKIVDANSFWCILYISIGQFLLKTPIIDKHNTNLGK